MLNKVSIGALVSAMVLMLGVFGIDVPEEVSSNMVAVVAGLVSIFAYLGTAFFVKESDRKIKKLKTKF